MGGSGAAAGGCDGEVVVASFKRSRRIFLKGGALRWKM
jgi:hypothetical protein